MLHRSLFVAGCGHDGRLGLGNEMNHSSFIRHPFFRQHNLVIVSIHLGGYHTFVRTTSGVYAFGLNEDGQLGLGEKSPSCRTPRLVPFFGDGSTLVDIACGAYHTVAWMIDGIYSCGSNSHGQLGQQDYDSRSNFTRVPTINAVEDTSSSAHVQQLLPVTHISCGTYHTLIGLKDIIIPRSIKNQQGGGGEGDEEVPYLYPIAIVACGKGDFGELGYDAEHWDVMAAKERRIKDGVHARAHHVGMGGDASSFNVLFGSGISSQEGAAAGGQGAGVYGDGGGEDIISEAPATTSTAGAPKLKPKPKFSIKSKVRRAEFSHPTLKPIRMQVLDDQAVRFSLPAETIDKNDRVTKRICNAAATIAEPYSAVTKVKRIVQLKAAHLHSIVQLEVELAEGSEPSASSWVQSYHFGCYFCNGVEGDESSIPILDTERTTFDTDGKEKMKQTGGIVFHAGHEICFGVTGLNHPKLPLAAASAPVLVRGKGNLGLKDEDSLEQEWRELLLHVTCTSSAQSAVEVRKLCGREHFLLWTRVRQEGDGRSSPSHDGSPPAVDYVYGFGDNLTGQVGCGSEDDKVLSPELVLHTIRPSGEAGQPSPPKHAVPGVDLVRVLDVACGIRHSMLLVEERLSN